MQNDGIDGIDGIGPKESWKIK